MAFVPYSIRHDGYLGYNDEAPGYIPSWERNKSQRGNSIDPSYLNEAKDNNLTINAKHLRVSLLDTDKLVKVNELKEVTNPIIFQGGNIPTVDGLLSNEIFGITRNDRANTCAYIDMGDSFLNPEVYKTWTKLDKNIIAIVHGTSYFKLDGHGKLIEDPEGETGLRFLKKVFQKINISRTTSLRRDANVNFIEACQRNPEGVWISKMIVIPAYYRDVDTSKKGKLQVGELNELYRNLIIASRSLKETSDYGLDMGESVRGRIQQIIVQIFDWFGTGTTVGGETTGPNIPGKIGVLRRSVMSKTTDYASRLVITGPELKYDKIEDMMSTLDYSAVPLSATLSTFMPFIIFSVKRYFENALSGGKDIPTYDKNGEYNGSVPVKDYQTQFSEDRIKKEIKRFMEGFSNRLIPVEVEGMDGKKYRLRFKGIRGKPEDFAKGINQANNLYQRDLVWVDIFFMAAVEVTQDKHILITRYPIDSIYNQFVSKVNVNSTNEKEPMIVDGKFYKYYPKIRQEDIGKNTSNMFVDTMQMSNLYLKGLGGKAIIEIASEYNKNLSNCWKPK